MPQNPRVYDVRRLRRPRKVPRLRLASRDGVEHQDVCSENSTDKAHGPATGNAAPFGATREASRGSQGAHDKQEDGSKPGNDDDDDATIREERNAVESRPEQPQRHAIRDSPLQEHILQQKRSYLTPRGKKSPQRKRNEDLRTKVLRSRPPLLIMPRGASPDDLNNVGKRDAHNENGIGNDGSLEDEQDDEVEDGLDMGTEIIRVSILYLDYYVDEDDTELPVIRVFGRKPNGDSLLVHVHNCLPYMFIKVHGHDSDYFVQQLEDVLTDSKFAKIIFSVTICQGVDFYGYHQESKPETFAKIEITDPLQLKPLGSFLQSGEHKLGRKFQPYETHVPYLLQFLSDYELAGMNYLRLSDFDMVSHVKRQTGQYPIGEIEVNVWNIIAPVYRRQSSPATTAAARGSNHMHVPSLRGWLDELRDSLGVNPEAQGSQAEISRSASLADDRVRSSGNSQLRERLLQWLVLNDPSPRSSSYLSTPATFESPNKLSGSASGDEHVLTQDAIEYLRTLNDNQYPSPRASAENRFSGDGEGDSAADGPDFEECEDLAEGKNLAHMTQQELENWDRQLSTQDVESELLKSNTHHLTSMKRKSAVANLSNAITCLLDDEVGEDEGITKEKDDHRGIGGSDYEDEENEEEEEEDLNLDSHQLRAGKCPKQRKLKPAHSDTSEYSKSKPVGPKSRVEQGSSLAHKTVSGIRNTSDSMLKATSPKLARSSQVDLENFAGFSQDTQIILRPRDLPPSFEEVCADPVLENTEHHVRPFFSDPADAAFERHERAPRTKVPLRKLLRYPRGQANKSILIPRRRPPSYEEVAESVKAGNVQGAIENRIDDRVDKGTRALDNNTTSRMDIQICRVTLVEVITSTRNKKMSNPKEDEVLCIYAATFEDTELISERHIFQAIGAQFTSERMVLNEFVRYVQAQDPDVIGGWEIQRRSLGYILKRAEELNLDDYASRLSRVPLGPQDPRHMNDAWGETEYSQIWLAGRHVFNIWRVIRKEIDLAQYTLEHVVQEFFGRPLPRYSQHYLYQRFHARATRDLAMNHLSHIVACVHDVLMHLDVITKTAEFSKLLGMDFFSTMTRGSQFQVEAVMVRVAKPQNYVLPSPSRDQVASQPGLEYIALNLEPLSSMYVDPVAVLDFRSLYPSVIIAYNLCFSTFVGKVDASGALVQEAGVFSRHACDRGAYPDRKDILRLLSNDEIFITGNGACFLTKSVREGVLPCMLREILFTRFAIKDGLKKCAREGWDNWRRVLDARQLALKMLANVTYGYTAASFSGRMPMSTLADAIVVMGKQALEASMREVQSETSPWRSICPSRPRVLYGDTDSLFVQFHNCKLEAAFHIANWVCNHMTMQFPHPMKLQFEKVYMPCMLVSKKRYCGLKFESIPKPGDPPARIESKGLENIRRDSCPIMKRIMNDMLQSVFLSRDLSLTKQVFQNHIRAILENKVSVKEFVFASKVRTPIEEQYKAGSYPPSVTVALRLAKIDPMAYPVYKERVQYVIADGLPSARLTDLVQPPSPGVRINATYYIKRKLIEPLQRLFRLVHVDVERWYSQMRKAQTVQLQARDYGFGGPVHRDGVRAYFQSATCVVCKRSFALGNATSTRQNSNAAEDFDPQLPICPQCLSIPQETALYIALASKRRDQARILHDRQCQACTGSVIHKDYCVNSNCPVYYSKALSQSW